MQFLKYPECYMGRILYITWLLSDNLWKSLSGLSDSWSCIWVPRKHLRLWIVPSYQIVSEKQGTDILYTTKHQVGLSVCTSVSLYISEHSIVMVRYSCVRDGEISGQVYHPRHQHFTFLHILVNICAYFCAYCKAYVAVHVPNYSTCTMTPVNKDRTWCIQSDICKAVVFAWRYIWLCQKRTSLCCVAFVWRAVFVRRFHCITSSC